MSDTLNEAQLTKLTAAVSQKVSSDLQSFTKVLSDKLEEGLKKQGEILKTLQSVSGEQTMLTEQLKAIAKENLDVLTKAKTSLSFLNTKLDEIERPEERIAETLEAHSQELKHIREVITSKRTIFDHLSQPYAPPLYMLIGLGAGVLLVLLAFSIWSSFALSFYEARIYGNIVNEKVQMTNSPGKTSSTDNTSKSPGTSTTGKTPADGDAGKATGSDNTPGATSR